jgi:hypothetical protein
MPGWAGRIRTTVWRAHPTPGTLAKEKSKVVGGGDNLPKTFSKLSDTRFYAAFNNFRFLADMLREIPDCVAFWRVAPEVRFNAFAIFSTGSLRARLLRVRKSSLVHERFSVDFLLFTEGLAICEFPLLCDCLIAYETSIGGECRGTYKDWFDLHSLFNWQLPI